MDSKRFSFSIDEIVAETDRWNALAQKPRRVIPKQGIVVKKTQWAPRWLQENMYIRGRWYPIVPRSILPPRVVFKPEPLEINGKLYYLEVKGYGFLGRHMFFHEHESQDVYYGMYLEQAIQEFDRLYLAAKAGIPVPLPIAVVEIPRQEYIKYGLLGFEQRIAGGLNWVTDVPVWLADIICKDASHEDFKESARRVMFWIKNHPEGIEEGIKAFATQFDHLPNPFGRNLSCAAALLSGEKVGYLIRATQCPMRVGDPLDSAIDTPANRKIAITMGDSFRRLLEVGLLHHCPGTGNWTLAGELTDLQDTFDLARQQDALVIHMAKVGHKDLKGFVRYLIGPDHAGKLDQYFLQGICKRNISFADATEEVYELVQQKMQTR